MQNDKTDPPELAPLTEDQIEAMIRLIKAGKLDFEIHRAKPGCWTHDIGLSVDHEELMAAMASEPSGVAQQQLEEAILLAEQSLNGIAHMAGKIEMQRWPWSVRRMMAEWATELRNYVAETRGDLDRLKTEKANLCPCSFPHLPHDKCDGSPAQTRTLGEGGAA